jgi:hypothetical protein
MLKMSQTRAFGCVILILRLNNLFFKIILKFLEITQKFHKNNWKFKKKIKKKSSNPQASPTIVVSINALSLCANEESKEAFHSNDITIKRQRASSRRRKKNSFYAAACYSFETCSRSFSPLCFHPDRERDGDREILLCVLSILFTKKNKKLFLCLRELAFFVYKISFLYLSTKGEAFLVNENGLGGIFYFVRDFFRWRFSVCVLFAYNIF